MTTFRSAHEGRPADPFEEYVVSTSTFSGARRLAGDVAAIRADYEGVWDRLTLEERAQIVDESVIRPEAVLKYQGGLAGAGKPGGLPFGACQVYPRLRHPVGMKTMLVEDTAGSQGEDLDSASSGCTYTYQDEHSAPFSWRTRSQQDLTFEFGRPASMASEDLNDNGLEILSASPSKILNRAPNLNVARMSRGNPSFAKPVHIPIVPTIPRPESVHVSVPPEQINNFVYESAPNRLVLDFSGIALNPDGGDPEETAATPRTSSPESNKSSKSLLSKMKRTLTPSLSNLRKKSSEDRPRVEANNLHEQHKRLSASVSSPAAQSPSSTTTKVDKPRQSLQMTSSVVCSSKLVKPSMAPPPPPCQTFNKKLEDKLEVDEMSKPFKQQHPPPPPVRTVSQKSFNRGEAEEKEVPEKSVAELDDFKIDLTTETELPKTGFDFLDNW